MANQRAPGTKLINIPMDVEFIGLINENLLQCGYADRSSFIRDAIAEKLESLKIKVPRRLLAPRPRVGSGARRNASAVSSKHSALARKVRALVLGEDKPKPEPPTPGGDDSPDLPTRGGKGPTS